MLIKYGRARRLLATESPAVYYIMSPGELDYSNPVDQSDYQTWLDSQLGGGQEQSIAWQNITAANIQALRSGS